MSCGKHGNQWNVILVLSSNESAVQEVQNAVLNDVQGCVVLVKLWKGDAAG